MNTTTSSFRSATHKFFAHLANSKKAARATRAERCANKTARRAALYVALAEEREFGFDAVSALFAQGFFWDAWALKRLRARAV